VIGQIVRPILENSPNEQFLIVTLDTKLKPIGCHIITIGTLDASLVHPREVFRHALLSNASSIILVHNHPSGDCEPSSQDRSVTDRLKRVGELLGITVIDHLIFGVDDNGDFQSVSLAEC
jgi:DNA repair protein RadC